MFIHDRLQLDTPINLYVAANNDLSFEKLPHQYIIFWNRAIDYYLCITMMKSYSIHVEKYCT
jgi:hypothetical protein